MSAAVRLMLVAGIVALGTEGSAAARPAPVRGSLAKRGYVVVAMATSGRVTTAPVRHGSFRLVPPARIFTLHLRDAKGRYAGPVVVGGTASRALVGVRAGARLGRVKARRGYATAHPPRRSVVRTGSAAARRGRPIGAGVAGAVRVSRPATGGGQPGSDRDRDGIPNSIDVDDDGDLVLDHVDRSNGAGARAAATIGPGDIYPNWVINVGLESSYLAGDPAAAGYALNWNASGQQPAKGKTIGFAGFVDRALDARAILLFVSRVGPFGLQCQLSYCTTSGKASDLTDAKRFPADFPVSGQSWGQAPGVTAFNPDREGITTTQGLDVTKAYAIRPHAGVSSISATDLLFLHSPPGSTTGTFMTNVAYVFGTVPALAAWSDGTTGAQVGYPVAHDGPGTQRSPIALHRAADGHYHLTMSVWPPQGNLTGAYQTLGWLEYVVAGRANGPGKETWRCPPQAYSGLNATSALGTQGVIDKRVDRPLDRADMVTFTTDLTLCMESSGRGTWGPGSPSQEVFVAGLSALNDASEGVGFAFRPADEPTGGGGGGGGGGTTTAPASGTWSFQGGSPGKLVNWNVAFAQDAVTQLDIQVHEATPVSSVSGPAGWTCAPVTTSQPEDTLECTHPAGQAAGTTASGQLQLQNDGTNGMPVTLKVVRAGVTSESTMTQAP